MERWYSIGMNFKSSFIEIFSFMFYWIWGLVMVAVEGAEAGSWG